MLCMGFEPEVADGSTEQWRLPQQLNVKLLFSKLGILSFCNDDECSQMIINNIFQLILLNLCMIFEINIPGLILMATLERHFIFTVLYLIYIVKNFLQLKTIIGCRHSSVDSSAPSIRTGFEYQAHHLCFFQIINLSFEL